MVLNMGYLYLCCLNVTKTKNNNKYIYFEIRIILYMYITGGQKTISKNHKVV